MQTTSWAHVMVSLTPRHHSKAKHIVQGIAGQSKPFDMQEAGTRGQFYFGQDGVLSGRYDTGLGGIFVIRLVPTSISIPWMQEQENIRKSCQKEGSGFERYDGLVKNISQGSTWELKNGSLYEGSEWWAPGEEYMATFIFEEIIASRGDDWVTSPIRNASTSGDEPPTTIAV